MPQGEVTGLELMERAGRGVVEAIFEEWPELRPARTGRWSCAGRATTAATGSWWRGCWRSGAGRWRSCPCGQRDAGCGGRRGRTGSGRWRSSGRWTGRTLPDRPLVIDAVFGTGLVRAVAPGVWGALSMAQQSGCRIVAVDILSGALRGQRARAQRERISGPAGRSDGDVRASAAGAHAGRWARRLSGRLAVAEIGLARWCDDYLRTATRWHLRRHPGGDDCPRTPVTSTPTATLVMLSGGVGRGGAARLAARGALRVGAGLVTVRVPAGRR